MKNFKPQLELNLNTFIFFLLTVEPQYNEVQGTGKICSLSQGFVISRFFSIYFTITGGNENCSLYQGLLCIEVHYIEVPL